MHKKPDFYFENIYWENDTEMVIGVDEVGRGSLAGPVVAGAAAIRKQVLKSSHRRYDFGGQAGIQERNIALKNILKLGIDDSKRMKPRERIMIKTFIEQYFHIALGEATVAEIDKFGIVKATQIAMRKAVVNLLYKAQNVNFFLLVDGCRVKYLPGGLKKQRSIIKGDQKSISIAAASIIAKVYRDNLMISLGRKYPSYKWELNKGYGTLSHRNVLKTLGICEHHRLLFVDSLI